MGSTSEETIAASNPPVANGREDDDDDVNNHVEHEHDHHHDHEHEHQHPLHPHLHHHHHHHHHVPPPHQHHHHHHHHHPQHHPHFHPHHNPRQPHREDDDDSFSSADDDEFPTSPTFQSHQHLPRIVAESEEDKKKKGSCTDSQCINGNLVALKALLFIFYGGVGVICTWLNHTQVSSRFSEKETLLIYGISSLLSLATPIIFGLCSDKSAKPKKVLSICLFLGGLVYPLILFVPPAVPYRFAERLTWCDDDSSSSNATSAVINRSSIFTSKDVYSSSRPMDVVSCLPSRINCTSSMAELITDVVGDCSEGCGGKLIISKCSRKCNDSMFSEDSEAFSRNRPSSTPSSTDYDLLDSLVAEAQVAPTEYEELLDEGIDPLSYLNGPPPHLCVDDSADFKYKSLCFAFDKDMHEIPLHASGLSPYTDDEGKCRYPLLGYSEKEEEFHHLLSCSPLSAHCHVSCELRWDSHESDQWTCQSDFMQWLISFIAFVAAHTLGTMLLITAAGLLNSAIVSMSHEHSGFFGCQYTYAALGFGLFSPAVTYLFQYIESSMDVPWNLHYILTYSVWLLLCALLALCLPYHAEWKPKPGSVRPMLCRWTMRGHTSLFFVILVILGALQCLLDVLAFHQIASVGASLFLIALGASALVGPALVFLCRVEKVIDYCGHHHIFSIALVVFSLQFTGYAYLTGSEAEWSILLRAMDSFSVLMVWVSASFTTYASAPRSLAATCQTVIVTLYCALGRGLGGVLGFVGLTFLSKDLLLKILALVAVFICVLYLMVHYWCLKTAPYMRQYDFDKPATYGSKGKYTPLKLMNGRRRSKNVAQSEDFDAKDLRDPIDDV